MFKIISLICGVLALLCTIVLLIVVKKAITKIDADKPFNASLLSKILLVVTIIAMVLLIISSVLDLLI